LLIAELVLRHQTPLLIRVSLLALLLCLALFFGFFRNWFTSLSSLSLQPVQRFGWESEKYSSNFLLRISSLFISIFIVALTVYSYQLGPEIEKGFVLSHFFLILAACFGLFIIKLVANRLYFGLHIATEVGDQLVDFQYSINQWFTLILAGLLVLDTFLYQLESGIFYLVLLLSVVYFLFRVFGTILMLQDKFKYPIFTVFVYLCTFEIVPALVIAKVLFVHS
jgi:hypothetical protein